MTELATDWHCDLERGPECIFVRLRSDETEAEAEPPLAEQLWSLLEEHLTYRLVLEFDQIELLHSYVIGQLLLLGRRLHIQGGMLRLCGLSAHNQLALAALQLEDHLPTYKNRFDAVVGF
jgi:anti-anti-sigma regulatory factor